MNINHAFINRVFLIKKLTVASESFNYFYFIWPASST